jgi:F420H(2)-dependent quinone reductase
VAQPSRPLSDKQIKSLNSTPVALGIKWMSRAQTWLFKKSGGRFGDKFLKGTEVGILTTTGRKSGQPRDVPLLFLQEGRRIVLVASQGGRDTHPLWYRNILADPKVTFQTKRETLSLVAREATDAERDEYWPKLDAMYPDYANYRSYTTRTIPIVLCDPA